MTSERPLGTFSDEIDRALAHIDRRLDATDKRVDERFDEQGQRIDELTTQVTTTNGNVRELQRWRSYMEGVKAGAGGSWGIFVGAVGVVVGAGGLVISLIMVAQR